MKKLLVLTLILLGFNSFAYETSLELEISDKDAKDLIAKVNEALGEEIEIKVSSILVEENFGVDKRKFTISLEDKSQFKEGVVKSFDLSEKRIRISNYGARRPEQITLLNHLGFQIRGAQTATYSYYIHEILVPTAYLDI